MGPDMMLKSRSLPPQLGTLPSTPASNSLPAQILQTPCGLVARSLEDVAPAEHFKLPTVIISGGHDHGKFYTLENLVKKRIFPRECGSRISMAIRLRLRAVREGSRPSVTLSHLASASAPLVLPSEAHLPAELALAFERLDEADGAAECEITIDICQEGSMNLDFVILPPPVLIPEAARKRSYAISRHYLQNTRDNPTLSVCVVKANSDLSDSLALKSVIDAGQRSNTILVLSKSEEVTHSNQEEQVLSRLLKTSRDSQLLHKLLACVATADYTSKFYSLDAAEEEEHRVFDQYIRNLICISEDNQVLARHKELRCMLSNEALVVKLASKMQEYIVQQWRPKSQQVLLPIVQSIQRKVHQLGMPVKSLTPQGVLEEVNYQVSWGSLCYQISSSKSSFQEVIPRRRVSQAISGCVPRLAELTFGTLAWAEQLHHTLRTIEAAVVNAVNANNISALLTSAYTAVFDPKAPQRLPFSSLGETGVGLDRFSSLKEHLLKDLLPARLVEYQQRASQLSSKLFQEAAQYLRSNASPSIEAAVLQQLAPGITGCVVSLVVQLFKDRPFDLSGVTLEEDKQVQTERASLNAQLAKLLDAQKSLDNMTYTAALIPANKFHLGTYKQAASAELLDLSDAEEVLTDPDLPSAALPTPDAPNAEAEYPTPNSPHSGSGSSSSSSHAGGSAASLAASLDLNEAVAESSSAGSVAEVEAHPESVSPTSSSTSDDFVEV